MRQKGVWDSKEYMAVSSKPRDNYIVDINMEKMGLYRSEDKR